MDTARRYGITEQSFRKIRELGRLYIDKTQYVYQLAHGSSDYVFLSRPRRFGKSLLVSTLQCYFEGRKELFKGLAIEKLETEWTAYPVLHFDMSMGRDFTPESLTRYLLYQLKDNEDKLGLESDEIDVNMRMSSLIKMACKKFGKPVVVLIDEYDAPVLGALHKPELLRELRGIMSNFYSPLKGSTDYLRFVFITGITRFSQLSIFSEMNNLDVISMKKQYAAICGITKEELEEQLVPDMENLANEMEITPQEAKEQLIQNYDGYHFAWPSPDIFNPYSLLNAFYEGRIKNYWFETATPSFVINMLRKYNILPSEIVKIETTESGFNTPIEDSDDYVPLLYQSGYLTIKDCDKKTGIYTLDLANKEVRTGLLDNLLKKYLPNGYNSGMRVKMAQMGAALAEEDITTVMQLMKEILRLIPYTTNTNYEGHYQQMLFSFFTLAGAEVQLEEHTASGRIDLEMKTRHRLYIIEMKLDGTAEEAMQQIEDNNYAAKFSDCGLPITKVGVSVDKETRTINQVLIKE